MKEIAYGSINFQKTIKFELSFILYENNVDNFNREKCCCDSIENRDKQEAEDNGEQRKALLEFPLNQGLSSWIGKYL